MPDWFYPLMLVVILAGYVFLFLQGRAAREGARRLEAKVEELLCRLEKDGGARSASEGRLEEVERLGTVQASALEGLVEGMGRVEQHLEQQAIERASAVQEAPARSLSPEDIAEAFLIAEGFSAITFTGQQAVPEGVRIAMRTQRGDELRHGHVVVSNGQVVDAALEVPTRQFP